MTVAELIAVSVRGIPLELHPPGDFVSDEIRRTGDFHEAEILDAIRPRITGGVLIDAGAMIGNHSAYLAGMVPHTAIHAFEPWPDNWALLQRNVARFPTVSVHPQALSDRPRRLLMRSEANRGHSEVVEGERIPEAEIDWYDVEAVTLDSFGFEDVTLLKIDVENHEPQVLAGAADTIARCRPLILIEDWTGKYAELLSGYQLAAAWPDTRQTYLFEPVP